MPDDARSADKNRSKFGPNLTGEKKMLPRLSVIALSYFLVTAARAETFPPEMLTKENVVDEGICKSNSDRVWVAIDGKGECIRFYAAGLTSGPNKSAIFFLHGNRLWGDKPISYDDADSLTLQENAERISRELNTAFVLVARPGVYGSSGDHRNRQQVREGQVVSAAIAAIRKKFDIQQVGLTGQSGGGTVAAYVLTQQPNLKCVALTSSALSIATILKLDPSSIYATRAGQSYNPIEDIGSVPNNPGRHIFVIGMEGDKFSPLINQQEYANALSARGHAVHFMEGEAIGSFRHTLEHTGRTVTAWCLAGVPIEEIRKRIRDKEVKG